MDFEAGCLFQSEWVLSGCADETGWKNLISKHMWIVEFADLSCDFPSFYMSLLFRSIGLEKLSNTQQNMYTSLFLAVKRPNQPICLFRSVSSSLLAILTKRKVRFPLVTNECLHRNTTTHKTQKHLGSYDCAIDSYNSCLFSFMVEIEHLCLYRLLCCIHSLATLLLYTNAYFKVFNHLRPFHLDQRTK